MAAASCRQSQSRDKLPLRWQAEVTEALPKNQTVQLLLSSVEKDAACPNRKLILFEMNHEVGLSYEFSVASALRKVR